MNKAAFIHYMVNVPEIDSAHWQLIENMNAVISLYKSNEVEQADVALTELAENLAEHHRDEESFMLSIGYPYTATHRQMHAEQYDQMKMIVQQSKEGAKVSYAVERLERNFSNHIDSQDMQYADWLRVNKHVDKAA